MRLTWKFLNYPEFYDFQSKKYEKKRQEVV